MAKDNRTTSTPRRATAVKATAGTDAYDQASLAITNVACAVRLLLSSSPDEHTSKLGHDVRDFLLSSFWTTPRGRTKRWTC